LWLTKIGPIRFDYGKTCANDPEERLMRTDAAEADHRIGQGGVEETCRGKTVAMNAQQLLQEISDYCRQTGLAESTFGRRAVNDGKIA